MTRSVRGLPRSNNTYDGQQPAINQTKQANAFVAIPSDNVMPTTGRDHGDDLHRCGHDQRAGVQQERGLPRPAADSTAGSWNQPAVTRWTSVDLSSPVRAWRNNKLYAARRSTAVVSAAVRVFGINTGSGVSLQFAAKHV